jgi:hypothetical protein
VFRPIALDSQGGVQRSAFTRTKIQNATSYGVYFQYPESCKLVPMGSSNHATSVPIRCLLSKVLGFGVGWFLGPPTAGQVYQISDHYLTGRTITNSATAGSLEPRSHAATQSWHTHTHTRYPFINPIDAVRRGSRRPTLPTRQNGVNGQDKAIAGVLRDRTGGQEPLPPHS